MPEKDFTPVFERLKAIIEPYRDQMNVTYDAQGHFSLDAPHTMSNGQPLFFASAQIKKNYVSFYLMPVYVQPELLDDISDDLRKRMQGKSCFNFKKVDEALFSELETLAKRGLEAYQAAGYLEKEQA